MAELSFRRMIASDLRLLHQWLQREHVRRWWSKRETYEEVVEHYLPAIEGRRPTDLYLILLDEQPVGFIQSYLVSDYPEYAGIVGVDDNVAGIDLFISDEESTGHGLGTRAIASFVREIVFGSPTTIACIADPDATNIASLRAFEKAGFQAVSEFVDPSDGAVHRLVRIERHSMSSSL